MRYMLYAYICVCVSVLVTNDPRYILLNIRVLLRSYTIQIHIKKTYIYNIVKKHSQKHQAGIPSIRILKESRCVCTYTYLPPLPPLPSLPSLVGLALVAGVRVRALFEFKQSNRAHWDQRWFQWYSTQKTCSTFFAFGPNIHDRMMQTSVQSTEREWLTSESESEPRPFEIQNKTQTDKRYKQTTKNDRDISRCDL